MKSLRLVVSGPLGQVYSERNKKFEPANFFSEVEIGGFAFSLPASNYVYADASLPEQPQPEKATVRCGARASAKRVW